MAKKKALMWFRQDLRMSDNPALCAAAQFGDLLPVYVVDQNLGGKHALGESSRWWLHYSLASLDKSLDGKLNVYRGDAYETILKLVKKHAIDGVFWNHCYEPWYVQGDREIQKEFEKNGIHVQTSNGSLLWEPDELLKKDGDYYKIFTPFYRNALSNGETPRTPLNKPRGLSLLRDSASPKKSVIDTLSPRGKRFDGLADHWDVGEKGAKKRLAAFCKQDLCDYVTNRDYPGQYGTSQLSPYLHFGELSPNQVWYAVSEHTGNRWYSKDKELFLRQLCWREFSYSLLYHFPTLPDKNFQDKFDAFAWRTNKKLLTAWQEGQTGYPIVDAGMRQLLQTGYMHNRVRMIVASFLVKNLLIHWHHGRDWFWQMLVDADLANNSASWQWVAGSGFDAAPYFRIFNPITQGEKFDPDGVYTRHFVPELKNMPDKYLFKPWMAPDDVLERAGVVLGKTYPEPLVDVKVSREKALAVYYSLKKKKK